MNLEEKRYQIYEKAFRKEWISSEEAVFLYESAPLAELMQAAYQFRQLLIPGEEVSWIIDRNINYTNVCITRCRFCNFSCSPGSKKAYITSESEYRKKIKELFALGGDQLLLQGGIHPDWDLEDYVRLFTNLKKEFPELKLHALGPHEVHHIALKSGLSYRETLEILHKSGLDSLPGAGAEILSDRVRSLISPAKCTSEEWLEVMRQAHLMNLITSATMMFGHMETLGERFLHLEKIRSLQAERPKHHTGFISFTPWPFRGKDTVLCKRYGVTDSVSIEEYVRMIALSRLMLTNIPNIQASWLTVGKTAGQLSLHGGANDLGSIMIEENVVSSAGGLQTTLDTESMKNMIREAGFIPVRRNQYYDLIQD